MLHRANLHWSCSKAARTIYKDDFDCVTWCSSQTGWCTPHSPALPSPPPETPKRRHVNTNPRWIRLHKQTHASESEAVGAWGVGGGGIRRGFVLDKTLCDFLLGSLSTVQAPGLIGETEANFQPGVNKQTNKQKKT